MATADERISVSREALRAELSELELRLVDRLSRALETKADEVTVNALEGRVASLELSRASREHLNTDFSEMGARIGRLERFRYGVPSVGILTLAVSAALFFFNH